MECLSENVFPDAENCCADVRNIGMWSRIPYICMCIIDMRVGRRRTLAAGYVLESSKGVPKSAPFKSLTRPTITHSPNKPMFTYKQ